MLDLCNIHDAVRHEGGVSRRLFMAYAASLSAACVLGARPRGAVAAPPSFDSDPFTLGVASGDPAARRRALDAPGPQAARAGRRAAARDVEVAWELADDEGMKNVVKRRHDARHAAARPLGPRRGRGAEARPLVLVPLPRRRRRQPRRPHPHAAPPTAHAGEAAVRVRLVPALRAGLFTAYEHMAKDDLDLVFHLGDYIYEGAALERPADPQARRRRAEDARRLPHPPRPVQNRPASAGHARPLPVVVTWDDHEFDNNYANVQSPSDVNVDPAEFLDSPRATPTRRTTR